MKVVASWASGDMGRLWQPFQASNMVFLVRGRTVETWLKGDSVWWVSQSVAWLSFCRSTVLLGSHHFWGYYHARAPDGWGALRDRLNDPQADIPIQVGLHCLLPVMEYQDWTVHGMGVWHQV